ARCEKAIQAVLSELTQPLETDAGNFSDLTLRDSCRSRFSGVDTQGKAIELSLKGARDDAVFEAGVTACLGGDQQLAKDVSRLINQDLAAGLIEKLSHTFGGAGSPFELNGQSIIPLGSPEAHFNLSMVDGQASVQVRLVYGEDARNLPDQTELSSDSRGELNFEIRMAPDGTPRLEGPVLFVSRVKERQAHLTELAKMDTNALTKMYQQEAPQRTRDGARTQLLRDIGAQLQSRALGNASAQYEAFSTVGDATKELTALAERAVASSQAVPAGPLDDATPISKAVVVDLNRKMDVRVLGDDGAVSKLLDDPPAGDAPSKATQYAQAFASKLQLTGTASLALSAVMGQSAHLSIERAWRESATRCDAGPGNLGLSPRNQSSTLTLQSDGAGGVYARFDTHKNVDGIVAPGAQVPTLVKPGSHIKTRLELHVGANGVVTQPEPYTYSTNLAGFAFT
ncbi:MAG TPA: hypothetical protein VLJ86_05970, partial [Ramlibacter sp.]|nr:hypothetical protein [Ramlibacter sp.]